jgi:Domain of unknown function (DUF4150)
MPARCTWADPLLVIFAIRPFQQFTQRKPDTMYVNCSAGGMALAGGDVCKTPPMGTPVSYTNIANLTEAIPNVPNIILAGGPTHNLQTEVPTTHDDEPGSMKGVKSGTVSDKSKNNQGSAIVILQGAPETHLTNSTEQNSNNASGSDIAPSQTIYMTMR